MTKIRVTQVKSKNGATDRQKANLRSLGIHKLNQSIELEPNAINRGMIEKVLHLVKVEEIN